MNRQPKCEGHCSQLPAGAAATISEAKRRPLYRQRPHAELKLSPPEWIKIHYAEEIARNALHKGLIHREDRGLYNDLNKWLSKHTLPPDLKIPTYADWNKERLDEIGPLSTGKLLSLLRKTGDQATRELIRLYEVARKRPAGR